MGWSRKGWGLSAGWKRMAALSGALLWTCTPGEANYTARLQTPACTGTAALAGVNYLRLRVSGAGMEPVEREIAVTAGTVDLPAIPFGEGRVVEVRGYTDLPRSGGRVVAVGRSRPFDVSGSAQERRPEVPIVLRRVGEFVRPGAGEGSCASLATPRAGHTATLLADGRVLLAGGFQLEAGGTSSTLASAELFNPMTGGMSAAPGLGGPRAFHTATRLPDGQVLLAGGEGDASLGSPPLRSALVVDAERGVTATLVLKVARGHHAAAADAGGRVLLVGGMGEGGAVVSEAEGYDPGMGRLVSVGAAVPRVGMSALAVGDGQRIAVVGGSDGTALRPEILFFSYQGGAFVPSGTGGHLSEPRRDGALVAYGGAQRLLYVGGYDTPGDITNETRFLASSQVLFPDEPSKSEVGPVVFERSELCAVALPDGRVMTLGGLGQTFGELRSDSHAELLSPGRGGGAPTMLGLKPLEHPRQQHTCTVLEDGSVLIVGGLEADGSERSTLGDLLIYTPVPLD